MRRRPKRPVLVSGAVLLALFIALRLAPRIVPWDGADSLESAEWSARILDRDGGELRVVPVDDSGLRRLHVPYGDLPPDLPRIVRVSEDRRFLFHPGFDPVSLVRAAVQYRRWGRAVSGGSTISMQLARIVSPRPEGVPVTAGMKVREMWRALQIESRYSKKEILEFYVNLVPFGRNVEGYPAAARLFFGRDLSELDAGELCALAVIPRSPAAYDPFLAAAANREAAAELLERSGRAGKEGATAASVHRRLPSGPAAWPFAAPHFVEAVLAGREDWPPERRSGAEPVVTTLDPRAQALTERLLASHVESAEAFRISNGAVVVADARTMDVLAYVGSADFRNEAAGGQIDGAAIVREPGSTLKPFLYASLLDKGWTAATVLPDIPTDFGGESVYAPENYNQQYHGPVRLRSALAASLNVPAVYALERLGVAEFVDDLVAAGFAGLEEQRDMLGVSLAVGGGGVKLTELLQAFAALRAGGVSTELRMTAGAKTESRRVWSGDAADIIVDILSSPDDRVMTFGRGGPVRFDYPVAMKTGTSNQFNNIWAVGLTSDLVAAAWMGNFDGSTVMAAPGSSLPAALLHEIFDALSGKGPLPIHSELETSRICRLSGMAATPHCPYTADELFVPGTLPDPCDWHVDGNGRRRPRVRYPQEYFRWARLYGYDVAFSENAELDILSPIDGAVFFLDPGAPPRSSVIMIQIVGSGRATLRIDGGMIFDGDLPAEVSWVLEKGSPEIVLSGDDGVVRRRIEVR